MEKNAIKSKEEEKRKKKQILSSVKINYSWEETYCPLESFLKITPVRD